MTTPRNFLCFNYKCIKSMSFAGYLEQRITIKVDKQVPEGPSWWNIPKPKNSISTNVQTGKKTKTGRD